jgi:hypothetical protein
LSFGTIAPGASIGGMFRQLCSVRVMQAGQTSGLGMGTQTVLVTYTNVPCSLQAMSTGRAMTYKAEGQTNVWDIYLPERIENGAALVLSVGSEFVVEGVTYRSIGTGVRQGSGGVQMLPVERQDR